MIRRSLLVIVVLLAIVPSALASEARPTLEELENEIICPTCHALLSLSDAPVADQIRDLIRERIAAGDTKGEIKDRLVSEFGEAVLAAPPKEGLNLLAWLLPLVGILVATVAVGVVIRRWARSAGRRGAEGDVTAREADPALEPDIERRVDDELARFDY